jgi:hypothetical protein
MFEPYGFTAYSNLTGIGLDLARKDLKESILALSFECDQANYLTSIYAQRDVFKVPSKLDGFG